MTYEKNLVDRITYYLSSGGLFNPELADHLAVRNLLMECREALAQPEQEPVAMVVSTAPERIWLDLGFDPSDEEDISFHDLVDATWSDDNATGYGIEYVRADTTPPQRKPLTQKQVDLILAKHELNYVRGKDRDDLLGAIRDIEAAHGIKGEA